MQTYNQKVRNILSKHMEFYQEKGLTIHQCAFLYANELYRMESSKNSHVKLYREYAIDVMYLDAYKLTTYMQKECITNDADIDLLYRLMDINDSDDLLAEVSADPSLLVKLIELCYQFKEMNVLGKINIIKSLSQYDNDWLEQRYPMHRQDLETYGIQITLQHLLKNIKNQTQHMENTLEIDFKEAVMTSVIGFIQNLVKSDYDNAINLLNEIAISDYVSSKALLIKIEEDDFLLDHIDLYENYSKNDILNKLIGNPDFLMNAIWTIASTYVYGEYEEISIQKDEIDESIGTSIQKKLS